MNRDMPISPMFDQLGVWLMESALREATADQILQGFGRGLVEAGVSLYRLSLGSMLLHPVFGALDTVYTARDDEVVSKLVSRQVITSEEFQNAPFFWAITSKTPFSHFRLGDGSVDPEFPIFDRLREEGVTDYLLFYESYGRTDEVLWSDLPPGMEGVLLSIATCRIGGFSELEVNYLKALIRPLALGIKAATNHQLARALMGTYLGHYSGEQVLHGVVERGDGGMIDCVLFYCDLRGSSKLAEQLPLNDYLALINTYFDCTAGAVTDHGGEVLKYVGDAVMAIFPVDPEKRPPVDMCRAAISAAQEAFARADEHNAMHTGHKISFGISLHVGEVMYGNVGTERRLDFTVIGPAVNEAARLEGLCKTLDTPLVISDSFRKFHNEDLCPLGRFQLAGMDHEIETFTLRGHEPHKS